MSLYNLIHGVNPLAGVLLPMLGLTPGDCGRFRDCYLASDDGDLRIHVYTRNGGGNREDYRDVTIALSEHPEYVYDADADFDCTYATYVFRVPEKFREALSQLVAENPDAVPASPQERFQTFMEKLRTRPDDPDVKRVTEAVAPMLAKAVDKP